MALLYCDIETAPIAEAAAYLPPQEAPSNYKDPEKIAAYIADAQARALAKAALDPGLLRIVAIAAQVDHDAAQVWLCPDVESERTALARLWRLATQATAQGGLLVGYNLLAFDLPAIITRSWLLGVQPAFTSLRRYGQHGVLDLMHRLDFDGLIPSRGLSWWCQRIGLGPDDVTSGKDMPGFVEAGDWASVEAHVRADLEKTVALAAWCGVAPF